MRCVNTMALRLSCTRNWIPASRHSDTSLPRRLFSCRASTAASDFNSVSSYCDRECSLEGWRRPLQPVESGQLVPIIALGKFDALHRGHRELAIAASSLGGAPWLVSFAGMAEVLRWPTRRPLVAPLDRRRVMRTWAAACGGKTPTECAIPFAEVRSMTPEAFVELLAKELQVGGVAVGYNYRFGYKAAGDSALLKSLGATYGLKVSVVDLIEHEGELQGEVVSSSFVREALAEGDMAAVAYCLGRPYRLVGEAVATAGSRLGMQSARLFNQPPAPGVYPVLVQVATPGSELGHVGEGLLAEAVVTEHEIDVMAAPDSVIARPDDLLVLDFMDSDPASMD